MKFEIGDDADRALTTTLVHELALCKECFDRFVYFASKNIHGNETKSIKISAYNAYSSFLHHLYEFYVGCIKRDRRNTSDIKSDELDTIFNKEVEKLLRNKRHAIEHGYAPEWENHISVYQVEVPTDFGPQFRRIRNRTAHADLRRAVPVNQLSLGDFYRLYHRFVYLLYAQPHWLWSVKDIEAFDWKAIEDFNLAARNG